MILKLMKKEWKELVKTGKIYVLLFVFLFFSIGSPVIAKFTPDIIKSLASGSEMQGIIIHLPPPTWKDALLQFFKNLNQIVFIVIVIVFIGSISEEKNRGTASILLSFGVERKKWLLSKFLFQLFVTFIFVLFSYILCAYYTYFLFKEISIYSSLFATLLYLIYVFFVLSLLIFSSSLGKNTIQSAGIFFAIFIIFNLISIFPNLNDYNPMSLSSFENQWILKGVLWKDAIKNIIFTLIYSFILLFLSIIHFENEEL
ncbi:MAG: ABC transporter permease subunit [Dictyoglomus sp.]